MQTVENKLFFQKIIEQHKGIVFKVAHTYCKNENNRQDLIQEILIQIWQSIHRYNEKYSITTWLYRISLNVAISYYRKNALRIQNHIPLNEQVYNITDSDINEKEQQMILLEKFINALKEIDKALMLLYLEEKTYKEIAEILGITETNVATKVGRIKSRLKQNFSSIKTP